MKNRDFRDFRQDILTAIIDIESFVDGYSYDKFVDDRKTLYAVARSIEVMGEATKNLPNSLR